MSQLQLDFRREPSHGLPVISILFRGRGKWRTLLVIVAVLAFVLWEVFGLHVDENHAGTPADVAAMTGMPVPSQATHIQVASFRQGMAFSNYARFEAPVNVCLSYATAVAKGQTLTADAPSSPVNVDRKYFKSLAWFDLAQASDLVGTEPGPCVWVDRARGVFYFYTGF